METMKRIGFYALFLTVWGLCSCEHAVLPTAEEEASLTKAFTFHLKGDFTKSYEEMTRAVRLEDDNTAGITDIWVLDYSPTADLPEGKLMQTVHQTTADEDFGHPSLSLSYGQHNLKFIASKGDTPSLTSGALSWTKVKDTFVLDYPVDVVASSNGNRAPELKRAITGVRIYPTDVIPANAQTMQITMTRSKTLSVMSLLANSGKNTTDEINLTPGRGKSGDDGVHVNTYTLCPEDELITDVSVRVLATDGTTISEFAVENVELQKNRMTVLKGECFGRANGFTVTIDEEWEDPLEQEF